MSEQTYTMKVKHGKAIVYESDTWREIEPYQYRELISAMQVGEQTAYRRQLLSIAESVTEWVRVRERKDVYRSGPCVYMLWHTAAPNLVKIGKTVNLANRTKQMKWHAVEGLSIAAGLTQDEVWRGEVRPIVYAKTPEPRELERAMHAELEEWRMHGTGWFEAEPALALVRQLVEEWRARGEQ